MRLYMHITSQSFVQSYRSFERNSYVHTSSTSDTAGIGFPHHYSHSYFYRASQQRAPQRTKIILESWSFLAGRIQLFLFSQMLGFSSDMTRKSWMKSNHFLRLNERTMPANKNALIRYKTIDNCLRNRYRRWTLDDLVEAYSDALYDMEGITKGVCARTVQMDIQIMRL